MQIGGIAMPTSDFRRNSVYTCVYIKSVHTLCATSAHKVYENIKKNSSRG